ncbi:hypothetical protein [Geothermobacter hydrogeniphilus]|uniref:Uncharacterized protein n=1 Tax=Geothermobacter hydrogeniphilus TaxID=1969733 RepID=A0A1X0YBF1_9BACT|nr:hypothetical protein [Geothermobacter hydrogeniphilus]ORJ62498.1 hypothetical protein B5V00_04220 [Geothermobacter hydrogeniphilus]
MSRPNTILTAGFALFSIFTSFLFVSYGLGGVSNELASQRLQLFSYVTAGYGLMNIYILSTAWRSREKWTLMASKLISFCFFGVLIMDQVKFGAETGRSMLVLPIVAVVLLVNWWAVRTLVRREG